MRQKNKKTVKKRSFVKFVLRAVCLFIAVCVSFSLVSQQIELSEKNKTLEKLKEQKEALVISNGEKKQLLEKSGEDEFVEQIAREYYNYAYPEEHIYIDISGS